MGTDRVGKESLFAHIPLNQGNTDSENNDTSSGITCPPRTPTLNPLKTFRWRSSSQGTRDEDGDRKLKDKKQRRSLILDNESKLVQSTKNRNKKSSLKQKKKSKERDKHKVAFEDKNDAFINEDDDNNSLAGSLCFVIDTEKDTVSVMSGENVSPSDIRRGSNSSIIVVTADQIQDSGIVSSIANGDDISSEANETSRLKYLLWPIVKLMTLLRFWRKPSSKENDSDADSVKNQDSDCSDKSMEEPGMNFSKEDYKNIFYDMQLQPVRI